MTRALYLFLEWLWLGLGLACLAAACAVLDGSRLARLEAWLAARDRAARLLLGIALPAAFVLFKLAQYADFHLMKESAGVANAFWNAAHGHGLVSAIYGGQSYLGGHFAFTFLLLAPVLWLVQSMTPFAVLHGAATGIIGLAAFELGRGAGKSSLLGWLAALMTVSNPMFRSVAVSFIDNVILAPALFLWAVHCWRTGRRGAALALGALLVTTREQVPFLLAGLALAGLAGPRGGRGRMLGLLAGATGLWLFELWVIRSSKGAWTDYFDTWGLFVHLGDSPGDIARNALLRPWLFAAALVWPWSKLWLAVKTLGSFALFPLLAGPALIPALATWLPHQLAASGTAFHGLQEHYAALLFGPLVWASVAGLVAVDRLGASARKAGFALALGACGANFVTSAVFLPPERSFPAAWHEAVPALASRIPSDAPLWCDEYLSPHFAARRYIKALPFGPEAVFERGAFKPEKVLYSEYWVRRAQAATVAGIFETLRGEGFVVEARAGDLVLLSRP
ncbi:MAG: DUF2079 domain-containing protein [Elusimicrobia bacterium]|nr:DUF2079 domain-containing protein [Elusimicrobiota bacterium]